jgi:hypothetical protein
VQVADHARAVQRRLGELGHFSGRLTGMWGPVSRAALRSFKEANGLPADGVWDTQTELALFQPEAALAEPFVGRWASDTKACSSRAAKGGYLPTIIETKRARAGDVTCAFGDKRQVAGTWHVVAQCSTGQERWTARIQLTVKEDRLTWFSERGSQEYRRCHKPFELARTAP